MILDIKSISECDSLQEKVVDLTNEAFALEREGNKGQAFHKYKMAFIIGKAISDFVYTSKLEPARSMTLQSIMHLSISAGCLEVGKELAQKIIKTSKYNDIKNDAFLFLKNAC